MLPPLPSSMRAAATTPAEPVGVRVVRFPDRWQPSPSHRRAGLRICCFRRPAQRSLALRPAWSLSRPRRPFRRSASDGFVTSTIRSNCYRLERQLPGGLSHPLDDGAFPRRTMRIAYTVSLNQVSP